MYTADSPLLLVYSVRRDDKVVDADVAVFHVHASSYHLVNRYQYLRLVPVE